MIWEWIVINALQNSPSHREGVEMSLRKKVKQLFTYHKNTRLLIRDLEMLHIRLSNRIYELEQFVEKQSK